MSAIEKPSATPTLHRCLECGELTAGSIGAAGIKWTYICQKCKDEADNALAAQTKGMGAIFADTAPRAANFSRAARSNWSCLDTEIEGVPVLVEFDVDAPDDRGMRVVTLHKISMVNREKVLIDIDDDKQLCERVMRECLDHFRSQQD